MPDSDYYTDSDPNDFDGDDEDFCDFCKEWLWNCGCDDVSEDVEEFIDLHYGEDLISFQENDDGNEDFVW